MEKTYIVIPALEPEPGLCAQIREFRDAVSSQVVVIDDGSGEDYREIFEQIAGMEGCVVLRHEKNYGKGRALKTGFAYVLETAGTESLMLCTDCDGQHRAEDGARLLKTAGRRPGTLVLGVRDFSGEDVPLKSRIGNRISSFLFRILGGIYLDDTQTGLRAFAGSLLDLMLEIPGERFEYEMRMLFTLAEKGIPILTEKIETVYINENEGTHFRPVKDSLQVMGALFGSAFRQFFRFSLSSIVCALLDVGLFWIFYEMLYKFFYENFFEISYSGIGFWIVAAATAAARILSAAANYALNRGWVFKRGAGRDSRRAAFRYLVLCAGIMAASALSVCAVSGLLNMRPAAAKILCDSVLFLFSFRIQKKWVFGGAGKDGGIYDG